MTSALKKLSNPTLLLFSVTLFLSAALMFGLQPMVGKMLLPIVGGTPAGWIVAMAFFQVSLLVGYFVAHFLSQLAPRKQGIAYLVCLAAGLIFLPAQLAGHDGLVSDHPGPFDVFLLLTCVVAIPFIALSATASTLQRLFMTTGHESARDPYFLYAASNLGSFAGLLLYPFVIEPYSTLTLQSQAWLVGYVILMVMAAICLMMSGKHAEKKQVAHNAAPISWQQRFEWIGLAFIPSGLMLAVTTHITTDVFSIPLLWVIPLSIYLLTFVIAFSRKSLIPYNWILRVQPAAAAAAVAFSFLIAGALTFKWYAFAIHFFAFTVVALMCHMRLARSRPGENPRHLTEFYLMLSIGGALGGILNAFIVPVVFDRLVEYPVFLVASVLCNENIRRKFTNVEAYIFFAGCVICTAVAMLQKFKMINGLYADFGLILTFALVCFSPRAFAIIGTIAFALVSLHHIQKPAVMTLRNFYGVIKVYENKSYATHNLLTNTRFMQHGTTLHGMQLQHPDYEKVPTTYYSRKGPLGNLIEAFEPKTVAAVGLGTGTINCYSTPNRKITFFDIDPDVMKIANTQFSYLSKCGYEQPEIILGDARLELKKLTNRKFDLIILDAFSSDTIPTHLLTREATEVYLDRLNPKGIIAFHISNRYFKLDGPITATGEELGLKNAIIMQTQTENPYATSSRWIILARPEVDLTKLANYGWVRAFVQDKTLKPWTDDYTNLIKVLEW